MIRQRSKKESIQKVIKLQIIIKNYSQHTAINAYLSQCSVSYSM